MKRWLRRLLLGIGAPLALACARGESVWPREDNARVYAIRASVAKAHPEIVEGFQAAADAWTAHGYPTRLHVGGWSFWRVYVVESWDTPGNPCRSSTSFDHLPNPAFSSGQKVCFYLNKGGSKIYWKQPRDCDAPGELNATTAAAHELGHQYGFGHACTTQLDRVTRKLPRCGPEHSALAMNQNVTCKTRLVLP